MIFTIEDLRKFLFSLEKKSIYNINLTSNKFELIINKDKTNIFIENKNVHMHAKKSKELQKTHKVIRKPEPQSQNKNITSRIHSQDSKTYSTIISPMVGTFYRSPGPNEPTFVEKLDIVEKKQIVCIIEAMKLMNEIEAEIHGEIVEILVNDGEIVDCGQALMKVKILNKEE